MADVTTIDISKERHNSATISAKTRYSAWAKAGLVLGTTTGAFLLAKATGAWSWVSSKFSAAAVDTSDLAVAMSVPTNTAVTFANSKTNSIAEATITKFGADNNPEINLHAMPQTAAVNFQELKLPQHTDHTIHLQTIPTAGLVAYYPFSGNANDASGNALNGLVNGANLTADRFGNANRAYSFDGIDDIITINANPIFDSCANYATISVWIKINGLNCINGGCSYISFGTGPFTIFPWYEQTSQTIIFRIDGNSCKSSDTYGGPDTYGISSINSNWHHYVGTFNNFNKKM